MPAPAFVSPAPPNAIQMTPAQHMEAIIAAWRVRPPTPAELQEFQGMGEQVQQIVMQATGQGTDVPGAPQQQGGPSSMPPAGPVEQGQSQDYGTGMGDPAELGM